MGVFIAVSIYQSALEKGTSWLTWLQSKLSRSFGWWLGWVGLVVYMDLCGIHYDRSVNGGNGVDVSSTGVVLIFHKDQYLH